MTPTEAQPVFHLHFEGDAPSEPTIPAAAFVQAIQALQRSIYLLAMANEGCELKQRIHWNRINCELERKYAVILSSPEEGGFDLPYKVGTVGRGQFDAVDVAKITVQHQEVLAAVQASDSQTLSRLIPSGDYRRRVVSELKKMQPAPRVGLVVSIENYLRQKLLDGKTALERLAPLLAELTTIAMHQRLSPLIIESLIVDDLKRVAAKPINFQITFDPNEGHYVAEGPFNMLVSGATRNKLEESLIDALRFLWREYVESDVKNFTEDAKALRQELLVTFSEIVDAA